VVYVNLEVIVKGSKWLPYCKGVPSYTSYIISTFPVISKYLQIDVYTLSK